jgi:hypothetical protein
MSSFANSIAEGDEAAAMRSWWNRNCKPFSDWFMNQDIVARLKLLRKGCPDLPKVTGATRAQEGQSLNATDMLLPEIAEDSLMAAGGQLCVLFITRRMVAPHSGIDSDMRMLRDLASIHQLPLFSVGDAIKEMDTPFVDLRDPSENIQCLSKEKTSPQVRAAVDKGLEDGTLATIEVYMALKVRRTAITKFIRVLFEEFERTSEELWKPSPLLDQLIEGERRMRQADIASTFMSEVS